VLIIVPRALFCFRFIPCCWMPFVMNCSKDVVHTCPSCRAVCGEFKRQQQGRVHHGGGMHRRRGMYVTVDLFNIKSCNTNGYQKNDL
jgi:hypothetical protein